MDFLLVHVPKFHNFYNPIGYFVLGNIFPMGLIPIADHVERQGYGVRILHLGCEKLHDPSFVLSRFVARDKPAMVGFSLHWHYQSVDVMREIQDLKRNFPDLPVVLGGVTASHYARDILQNHPQVDFIIRGEGEEPAAALLACLREGGDLGKVPNLSRRLGEGVHHNPISFVADRAFLDRVSFHRYELMENAERYFESCNHVILSRSFPRRLNARIFPSGRMGHVVCVGRGCPVECSYCAGSRSSAKRIMGRDGVTLRSIDSVLAELVEIAKRGISRLYFPIDPYPGSSYYPELFSRMRDKGLRFGAGFESYGLPDEAFLAAFSETFGAGPDNPVYLGVETGDEELRKKNRGYSFTNPQLFECLDEMEKRGIFFHLSYTLGLPGESRDTLAATKSLWRKVQARYGDRAGQSATIINLDPGSPAERDPDKYDILVRPRSFDEMAAEHEATHRESLGGWGHFPMSHECRGLFDASKTPGRRATERILQKLKCRSFCPYFRMAPLPYPLNRGVCLAVGAAFRIHGRLRGLKPQALRTRRIDAGTREGRHDMNNPG